MRRTIALVGCVLLLTTFACSKKQTPSPTSEPTATVAKPTATPCSLSGATNEDKSGDSGQVGPVIDVRQTAEGCPRIVFEFKDNVPGYKVGYKDGPFSECGSGKTVDTSSWNANAFIDVRLEPSGGPDLSSDTGEPYYKGPRDIAVDGAALKHLKVVCDFEGVFEWLVGLDAKHPFDVTTFDGPLRLVIDISGSA